MIAYKEVKSILNKHKKRDTWFLDDYSINPYEGCGFNCTYCYVHGSKYGENLAEKIVTMLARRPEINITRVMVMIVLGVRDIISPTDAAMTVLAFPIA